MSNRAKRPRRRLNAKGREIYSPHVRLHRWLLESPAYRDLRPIDRALLVEMYALYNGHNNGALFLSVREAADRLGVSPNTACSALKRIVEHGFARPRVAGAFHWKQRIATTWLLAEFDCDGIPATKDFMRWTPPPKSKHGRKN